MDKLLRTECSLDRAISLLDKLAFLHPNLTKDCAIASLELRNCFNKEEHHPLPEDAWIEARGLYLLTLKDALEQIEECCKTGFEFKVENAKLYYRPL